VSDNKKRSVEFNEPKEIIPDNINDADLTHWEQQEVEKKKQEVERLKQEVAILKEEADRIKQNTAERKSIAR